MWSAIPADANDAAGANLPSIPEVLSSHGVATLALRAALDPRGRPAFFWHGREVAPTLRVWPGDRIALHFTNDLPARCGRTMACNANLHFHGLSVAPVAPADDVITTAIAPGHSFDYSIVIGLHQPPGLYWYHPHAHGLANWEIGNGMAGAIVVQGIANDVPSLTGLREQVIVLRDLPVDASVRAAERPQLRGPASPAAPPRQDDDQGPPCGSETDAEPTINGLPSATIGIRPHERQLWRILNASAHRHFDLALTGTRMVLVAQDGVPLDRLNAARPRESLDHLVVPPGGRAELEVSGSSSRQYLVSQCYDAGPNGDVNPYAVLGELVDDGGRSHESVHVAAPRASPAGRANLLPAMRPARRRVIHFQEDARGFYIDRRAYDPSKRPAVVARAGTTEEWTLVNETDEVHTFHIHQVHFFVEATNGRRERDPRWLDVVDLPPQRRLSNGKAQPSRVRVLIDFRDPVIRGTFLFHCHIVDHEDGGMMAKVRVI